MKTVKSIQTKPGKVKPIIAAMALAGFSVGGVVAQPIVSVGGSINASATTSVSTSFPSLNANKSMNFGYSGNMDVNMPHGTDAVGSVIADIGSDSTYSQTLPGLGAPDMPSEQQPNGGATASLVSDTASQAAANLPGGPSAPSGQVVASTANSTASQVSAAVDGAQSPAPETDSGNDAQESDSGDDLAAPQDSVPESGNGDSGLQASAVSDTASSVTGRADGSSADLPSMDLSGAIAGSAIAQASGYVSGMDGNTRSLDITGSLVSDTAADIKGHIGEGKPEDSDSVADNAQDTDAEEPASDTESSGDDVAENADVVPETDGDTADQQSPQGTELAASVENHNRADAFANLYQ